MVTSLIMNSLNIVGNAILIYGLGMGVEGAAIPTLISRIVCAVLIVVMLRHRQDQIRLDSYFHLGFDWTMIKRILQIGIPNGLENGMFQIGKILVQSLVAMFGTASIAANAVANNFASMEVIPAAAIGLGLVTVVGQCVGAGKIEEARYYTKKLMKWAYMASIALNVCILLGANVLLKLYNLSPETLDIAFKLLFIHGFFVMVIWPDFLHAAHALRAANDARIYDERFDRVDVDLPDRSELCIRSGFRAGRCWRLAGDDLRLVCAFRFLCGSLPRRPLGPAVS